MGTRGIMGFRKNGQDKLTYNHFDSYPDGLGASVVDFCRNTSIDEMNEIFDRIKLVKEDKKPTVEQIEECKQWLNRHVSQQTEYEWYCLLREAQGELSAYKSLRYMIDNHNFIKDSLFCEFGYIINLDDNTLEFWKGFQKEPQKGNRYGTKISEDRGNGTKYYPCRLMEVYPLDSIPENVVENMNLLAYGKDEEEEVM